ncbi:MAG: tripartite tricarboxylate transporter TctB family protein [Rhizobiaceae bacterium]
MPISRHKALMHDVYLAIGALFLAGMLFYGAMGLPTPRFEPMGSAALPQILGGLIVFLALLLLLNVWRKLQAAGETASEEKPSTEAQGLAKFRPLGVPACLVIYVGALDFLQAPFVISTIALVVVLGMLLSKPTLRTALIFALFGLVLSVSINLVFTHFLFVDLG